ncbi:CRISPR-associated protein, Csx11 family [Thermoanaerobacter sp. YS13]|uniref:CRISPR-associated protein Csx11 n=1 Tax=Thermoanaerobacter sp. YS13 TaxID=1511746 RepID=UPI000575335D|nr:CRISPR-associated protein Csx11 [Thermoanaerobacter sp. YS13]KHO62654.1 CRISPR-associated protein, Csx11 family [Thermoanaerobacter sp. YS13]
MSGLNLENLKKYKDEILKAEIGALLFNLGKTHVGFSFWKPYFPNSNYKWSSYKEYVDKFLDTELTQVDKQLEDFINAIQINLTFITNLIKMKEIMQGGESSLDFVNKIFFRGCENINSGIDKGSPKKQLEGNLWISNAFGSFKKNVESQDFDDARISFYNKLHNFLSCNNYYEKPDWQEIRKFVFAEIKNWYSRLLSDSRFPVNDVTLWDQVYMTATMFKAVLAHLCIDSSKVDDYMKNPSSIRWRILGIQYDKLGLAEKGYKPQQIQWYREVSKEIDDEIKKLLEYVYPIGNEIYRDETGIYFLVGEDLGEDLKDERSLAKLKSDLKEIEGKIIDIFKTNSFDELYPAIFLTKASRGIMNLTYLLEKAKENFLKADWSKKETDICLEKSESGKAKGICQVCGQRLVFERDKSDEDKNICDICLKEKTQGRIERWFKNRDKETIWIDELKDKNDRIALVTMKFELYDWLNGNMLNSMLVREEDFNDYISIIKDLLNLIKSELSKGELESLKIDNTAEDKIKKFLLLYDVGGIYKPFNEVYEHLKKNKNIDNVPGRHKDLTKRLLAEDWIEDFSFFNKSSRMITINKKRNESIQNYLKDNGAKGHLYEIFAINYLILQIYNTLLERSIGDRWEEFIKQKLGNKIDFENRKIDWQNLTDDDIEFLSTLIFQFILRKNSSPARLRRIWDSTKEFFEDIKANICAYAGIPQNRRVRYYWGNVKIENKNIPDGEYYDGEAIFWADKGKVYLISNIKDFTNDKKFNLKKYEDKKNIGTSLNLNDSTKSEYYQPYISIIDPTPISWQFIIPAEYVPNLIENVIKKYSENFKFVYGKLPLHIGIVVQDYKKPLYVGVKALRKIRRDVEDTEELILEEKAFKIKNVLKCQKIEESLNNTHNYYSLYWGTHKKCYEVFLKPNNKNKKWIESIDELGDNEEINIIPNTFDFEFLDTNTRRNDIYYDEKKDNNGENKGWKRKIAPKSSRPYDLETWEKFKKFKELFGKENINGSIRSTKLQKLISVLYEKWEVLVNYENQKEDVKEGIKAFLASSFVNILKLNNDKDLADRIRDLFDIDKSEKDVKIYEQLKRKMTSDNVQLFLDMFEFWHTTLREV